MAANFEIKKLKSSIKSNTVAYRGEKACTV